MLMPGIETIGISLGMTRICMGVDDSY